MIKKFQYQLVSEIKDVFKLLQNYIFLELNLFVRKYPSFFRVNDKSTSSNKCVIHLIEIIV